MAPGQWVNSQCFGTYRGNMLNVIHNFEAISTSYRIFLDFWGKLQIFKASSHKKVHFLVTILLLYLTRKYPLRGYFLGVLTHTTAWNRLWGGEQTHVLV